MKHIFFLILLNIILTASDINLHKVKILETIMQEVTLKTQKLIWSDNQDLLYKLKDGKKLNIVNNCESANLIIIENSNILKECKNKKIFVLKYDLLAEIKTSFGALFWKKGRPNIIILEPRINQQSIKIKDKLNPYLEDRIW